MKDITLKEKYTAIKNSDACGNLTESYGGSQSWFKDKRMSVYGCGIIAIGDIILYLKGDTNIEQTNYMNFINRLVNSFFFLPPITKGKTGIGLSIGFNIYAIVNKLPYRAHWGIPVKDMKTAIRKMLLRNIPVLFSVGANFPFIWSKKGIRVYEKREGRYNEKYMVSKHYMVITAIISEEDKTQWYEISNWGRKLYINCNEYEEFIRKNSCSLFSNILYLLEH